MNKNKCRAILWRNWHSVRCTRKAWKDGYCEQHHPDTKAERQRKNEGGAG